MFSNDPYVHEMYQLLLGENVHWHDREAWVYSHDVHTRYPFQGALHGLPPDVIRECIVGAIEAKYGAINDKIEISKVLQGEKVHTNTSTNGPQPRIDERSFGDVKDCCADGVLESTASLGRPSPRGSAVNDEPSLGNHGIGSNLIDLVKAMSKENLSENGHSNGVGKCNGNGQSTTVKPQDEATPANFEEFIYNVWGRGIAKHFAIPYNRKLWAVPLNEMETSWLGGRVPQPNLEEMIDGALQPVAKPQGPNARFGYPLHGGFQALMNGFLPHVADRLRLNTSISQVSVREKTVTTSDGQKIPFDVLISTMPLPLLIKAMGDEAPLKIQDAARKLRYVSVRCVNLGIGRPNLTNKHWIYYPGPTAFHRTFVQGNASPHSNPDGGFGLTCEITYSPHKPLPCDGNALVERCVQDCIEVGIMKERDPIWVANQIDMPFAYVVYDHARPRVVATIREWLKDNQILLAGRYSEWEYYNSDHAFIAGKRVAQEALTLRQLIVSSSHR